MSAKDRAWVRDRVRAMVVVVMVLVRVRLLDLCERYDELTSLSDPKVTHI